MLLPAPAQATIVAVDHRVAVTFSEFQPGAEQGTYSTEVRIKNHSAVPILAPLRLSVGNIEGKLIQALNAEGIGADGLPMDRDRAQRQLRDDHRRRIRQRDRNGLLQRAAERDGIGPFDDTDDRRKEFRGHTERVGSGRDDTQRGGLPVTGSVVMEQCRRDVVRDSAQQ